MTTAGEIVDKVNPFHSSPLSNFKNLSPTLTHVFDNYPIVRETSVVILEVSFINYIVTLTVNLYLDFKTSILDKYFTFINDFINFFDNYFKTYLFVKGIDYWIPSLQRLHLSHFYPSNQWKNFQHISYGVSKWFESIFSPIFSPVMKYINYSLEYFIDNYLPSSTLKGSVSSNNANGVVSPTEANGRAVQPASRTTVVDATAEEGRISTESAKGVDKFVELTNVAIDRVQPLVKKKITSIKSVPKDIQTKVTKSSSGLAKSFGLKKAKDKAESSTEETNEGVNGTLEFPHEESTANATGSKSVANGTSNNGSTVEVGA